MARWAYLPDTRRCIRTDPMAHSLPEIPTCFATCSIGSEAIESLDSSRKASRRRASPPPSYRCPICSPSHVESSAETSIEKTMTLCSVGPEVKDLCSKMGLEILMLQPISNFEGWPEGSDEREDAWESARGWIRIMQAVGTSMLRVSEPCWLCFWSQT